MPEFTIDDINDPNLLKELKVHFEQRVVKFDDVKEAGWFIKNIGPIIQSNEFSSLDGDLQRGYKQLLVQCSFVALPFNTEQELIELFSKQFLVALELSDYLELWPKLKVILYRYDYEERDAFKLRLRQALEGNQQFVTTIKPVIDGHETNPTISSWLRDYLTDVGAGPVDSYRLNEYLTNSVNAKQLSSGERSKIRTLLTIYEKLKRSSLTPEGLEESISTNIDGREVVLKEGHVQEYDPRLINALKLFREKGLIDVNKADKILGNDIGNSRTIYTQAEVSETTAGNRQTDAKVVNLKDKPLNSELTESVGLQTDISAGALAPSSNIPFIYPSPQVLKITKPALIFDIEDEKEADKYRAKAGAPPVLEHVLRQYVDEIIKTKNLVFKDEVNERRFIQLMVSRLKDVRGPLEIAESLRKPSEAGGLGMSEEKADQVQQIVEQAKREFENRKKAGELKAALPEPPLPPPAKKIEPPKPNFDAEAAKAWRNQMLQDLQKQGQPIPIVTSSASPSAAPPKPQLTDVKAPPKVVGPLEELRSLTLVDFRRLGASPQEALQKIKGKIDLLGETSVARRVEAVRAWKSSIVYQQYLRLGRDSIEQGKSVSDIVNGYQALGEPVLTEQEFTAIADFNSRLRF